MSARIIHGLPTKCRPTILEKNPPVVSACEREFPDQLNRSWANSLKMHMFTGVICWTLAKAISASCLCPQFPLLYGIVGYSGPTLAVEELVWATLGQLCWLCCGRASVGYSGPTFANVPWRVSVGGCAVEGLVGYSGLTLVNVLWKWATLGPLWRMCCGKASVGGCAVEGLVGYSELVNVLWKS